MHFEKSESGLKKDNHSLESILELYRSIVNTTPDFIVLTDLDGKIRLVNDCTIQRSGLGRSEIEGKNILDFLLPEDRDKARYNTLSMFLSREKAGLNEFTLIMNGGERVPFEVNGDVLLDSKGIPSGFVFICRDITPRRHAEKMVKTADDRFRFITKNIPGVVFQFSASNKGKNTLVYLSEKSVKYIGRSFTDPNDVSRIFIRSIHEEDREGFLKSIGNAASSASPWDYVFRYKNHSGELMWLQGLALPSQNNEGIIYSGIVLDISNIKQAEHLYRLSEEKFSRVFMTVPECIAITRIEDGFFIDINSGFEEISGWRREDVIGELAVEINIWADIAERDFLKKELLAGREIVRREAFFRRRDGKIRSGVYSARPIQIGDEACLVIVIQDITYLKIMEAERLKLEQQLIHVQKMDAVGQLAGGVAHDFNNILSVIQGNVSLILMRSRPEDYDYERLVRIDESVKRGANLTRQLLGFARGGKYEMKVIPVNDLVIKTMNFFIETRRDIVAEFDLKADVSPVEADSEQIEQVLLNLYINAAQAMPGGGKICTGTCNIIMNEYEANANSVKTGEYVKISVSDNGNGMDKETLGRIFEPFFTTKSVTGGTGLGLASAYGIIRNHNGIINVYSQPGMGTTFNIYLPSSDKDIEIDEKITNTGLVYGKGGILFIDDEPPILDFAAEFLELMGYTVFTASGGSEAVDIFRDKRGLIDLVVMDMIMPGINGSRLILMLKEINPEIRIILSSGYSMQGDVQKIMEHGCHGFIQKPFKMADLACIISRTLNSPAV